MAFWVALHWRRFICRHHISTSHSASTFLFQSRLSTVVFDVVYSFLLPNLPRVPRFLFTFITRRSSFPVGLYGILTAISTPTYQPFRSTSVTFFSRTYPHGPSPQPNLSPRSATRRELAPHMPVAARPTTLPVCSVPSTAQSSTSLWPISRSHSSVGGTCMPLTWNHPLMSGSFAMSWYLCGALLVSICSLGGGLAHLVNNNMSSSQKQR